MLHTRYGGALRWCFVMADVAIRAALLSATVKRFFATDQSVDTSMQSLSVLLVMIMLMLSQAAGDVVRCPRSLQAGTHACTTANLFQLETQTIQQIFHASERTTKAASRSLEMLISAAV